MAPVFRLSGCVCAGAVAVAVALAVPSAAQDPPRALTIDAIYDPERRLDFSGTPATNLRWVDEANYLQTRRVGRGVEWLKVDAVSGRTSTLFDAARMEDALAALPGMTREKAADSARAADLIL